MKPVYQGWHSRGYLPHFDLVNRYQAVTFRLADSMPQALLQKWETEISSICESSFRDRELHRRIEKYLDAGHGCCALREPEVAEMMQNALLHFDGQRYRLLAWCVMPNHVHALVTCLPQNSLSDVMHSWKSFTAHRICKMRRPLGALPFPSEKPHIISSVPKGPVWQRDYYDRFIRDEEHFWNTVRYIERNPVKARLVKACEKWPWSSAGRRKQSP